jgi:NAD(P)-dependent dehydrogenase (short-subunit alcohol dehydrogenase family)
MTRPPTTLTEKEAAGSDRPNVSVVRSNAASVAYALQWSAAMPNGILGRLTSSGQALAAGLFTGTPTSRRGFALAGKNALVTGGARGLGFEIARLLVAKGANVAIVAYEANDVQRAVDDLRDTSPNDDARIVGEACDLRDADAIAAMLGRVRTRVGPIDVLVNNADSIEVGPLDAMCVEDFEDAMRLHCFAPLRIILGVRDDMRARGGGRIANISSIGGIVSVPHLLPYSASKFALVGLSQGMHTELARDNIVVSTIAPGLMRTGSSRRVLFKGDHEKDYGWFAVSDSLPLLSMAPSRAARRIVRAMEHGETHVVVGLPAKLAAFASGIAPGVVAQALTIANTALPAGYAHG